MLIFDLSAKFAHVGLPSVYLNTFVLVATKPIWSIHWMIQYNLFRESDVSPGQTEIKQGKFVDFISPGEGLF